MSAEVRATSFTRICSIARTRIKLPWLLAVARSPASTQAGEAAALLQATLREDHGTDWNAWSERIRLWLQTPTRDRIPEANVGN